MLFRIRVCDTYPFVILVCAHSPSYIAHDSWKPRVGGRNDAPQVVNQNEFQLWTKVQFLDQRWDKLFASERNADVISSGKTSKSQCPLWDKSECNENCFPVSILSYRIEKNMYVSVVQESSIDLNYGLAIFECIDALWKSLEEAVELANVQNNTIILVVRLRF